MVAALIETGFSEDGQPEDLRPALTVVPELLPALRSRREAPRRPSAPSRAVIRRRRLVVGAVAGAILLGLLLGLQVLFGRPGGGPLASVGSPAAAEPAVARIWVVRPGDTLWSIALASGGQGDIRPLVARLGAEVGGRPLHPGERIRVP